jgi:hypothetical protein
MEVELVNDGPVTLLWEDDPESLDRLVSGTGTGTEAGTD